MPPAAWTAPFMKSVSHVELRRNREQAGLQELADWKDRRALLEELFGAQVRRQKQEARFELRNVVVFGMSADVTLSVSGCACSVATKSPVRGCSARARTHFASRTRQTWSRLKGTHADGANSLHELDEEVAQSELYAVLIELASAPAGELEEELAKALKPDVALTMGMVQDVLDELLSSAPSGTDGTSGSTKLKTMSTMTAGDKQIISSQVKTMCSPPTTSTAGNIIAENDASWW
ncbi:hypothetical protein DFH11DRAFT_1548719 [Phellopilus nigrolimitatus]|nr:hypothetical protein DFH11DRAFT_1548719 [Phellopilus nigrolimitatus]